MLCGSCDFFLKPVIQAIADDPRAINWNVYHFKWEIMLATMKRANDLYYLWTFDPIFI